MRKNFSAADLDDAREAVLPWAPMTAVPISEKAKFRQSLSSSDLKAMGQIHSVDIYMYLFRLKCKTRKLRLDTRRQSYAEWRASIGKYHSESVCEKDNFKGVPRDEDVSKINNSLKWIREELTKMREQDEDLARQFLTIHSEIQRLKLEWSWQVHELTLQDAVMDLQEVDEIKRISDLPLASDTEMSLVDLGLTKMNLCHRKYSVL